MPRTSNFKCTSCRFEQELLFKSFDDLMANKDHIECPKCKCRMEMLFGAPNFFTKENNDEVSAKPSSYWRNAERNRQIRQRKEQDTVREKVHYKDKVTMKKLENQRTNQGREE